MVVDVLACTMFGSNHHEQINAARKILIKKTVRLGKCHPYKGWPISVTFVYNEDCEHLLAKSKQKMFVTKTYILRKGGTKVKPKNNRRKPYLFKCLTCELRWSTCKERNDHFKQRHCKLQCKNANGSSEPPVLTLHQHIHNDGQFECNVCKAFFPFKSQLDHHMVCHSETREYKCLEPFCDCDFIHKSDLVKHERTHSGVVYKFSQCNNSNPDKRNYNQHLRKHTKETQYQCKMCGE